MKIVKTVGTSAREESQIYVIINDNLLPEQLREMAVSLLNSKELMRLVEGLPPEDQERFLMRVDRVSQNPRAVVLPRNLLSLLPQRLFRLSTLQLQSL